MKKILAIVALAIFVVSIQAQVKPPTESAVDRFLRYVKIDTQSAEEQPAPPSTKKQFDLANLLVGELKALGAENVRVSEYAIVYAMIPGNLPDNSKVPTIGLISHMDTSPAVSGANVKAIIHKNYQGGDIVLPGDTSQVISVAKNPILKNMIGDDIITADGTTLLGSDDKSGIAEIMTLVDTLMQNPQIKHGNIAIAFTPDEEVGGGIDKFDIKGFGAKYAYTVDGDTPGQVDNETWSARTATVTFTGKSTHPGSAKGIMVNSSYAAGDFLTRFPKNMLPETTEGRVGFIHPYVGNLDIETSTIKILLRDFEISGLEAKEKVIKAMVAATQKKFPNVQIKVDFALNYLNMKEELKKYPEIIENAMEATRRAGFKDARLNAIRGGTDGSRLTAMGLPTPNLPTGGQNFHGKLEFNSRKGIEKAVETLLHLVQVYAEKAK